MLFSLNVKGQKVVNLDTIDNTVYLGKFKLKTPSFFKSKYTYDPLIDKYIYTTKIGEIDVGVPLILTPQEYRERIKDESIKSYFSEKIDLLKEDDTNESDKLKNLLPDLYINSNFFNQYLEEIILNLLHKDLYPWTLEQDTRKAITLQFQEETKVI